MQVFEHFFSNKMFAYACVYPAQCVRTFGGLLVCRTNKGVKRYYKYMSFFPYFPNFWQQKLHFFTFSCIYAFFFVILRRKIELL